jgi:hypothetical protein
MQAEEKEKQNREISTVLSLLEAYRLPVSMRFQLDL